MNSSTETLSPQGSASLCLETQAFLATATEAELREYLLEDISDEEHGRHCMQWLLSNRAAMANGLLCGLYNVAVYKTGDSCFAESAPTDELDKFFVAVNASGGVSEKTMEALNAIPLANSFEQGEALAVKHLQLVEAFMGTESAFLCATT